MLNPEPNVMISDFPAHLYPYTITFFRVSDGEELASIAVPGPGVTPIPAVVDNGNEAGSFVEFADLDYCWYVPQVGVQ